MRRVLTLLLRTELENMLNTKVALLQATRPHRLNITTGGPSLLDHLTADASLTANESAKQGLADMALLFSLLRAYNVLDRVCSFNFLAPHFN
jgi:hypothetical protein